MRLALYQGPSPSGDIPAAFQAVEQTLSTTAASGADMALMPEIFLPGYNAANIAHQPLDGDWGQRLSALTRESGVALTIGMAVMDGDAPRNSAVLFSSTGDVLTAYHKIQLFGPREAALYRPGDAYVTFDYAGRRCALLICYDVEFPEHTRALARMGVELILIPTANMAPYDNVNRYAVSARAMENDLTVAYCNYCGTEGDLDYTGGSLIAGPDGEPLALAGPSPALLITDIPGRDDPRSRPTEHLADLRHINIRETS